eukprot:TRINITY_DN81547_c0_g1_i1.p1 TRINITY_DN81547_c0_g1~~TRINITY_DN81547_c0_g1_i1.p1  ORF type:complete len:194 (+),score=36.68 TRINITY_DN81547_c0_g1_i1:100-681(+)
MAEAMTPRAPQAPRPQRTTRRLFGGSSSSSASGHREPAIATEAPVATFAPSRAGILTPRQLTPRSLPPLGLTSDVAGRSKAIDSRAVSKDSIRCPLKSSPSLNEAQVNTAPPTPEVPEVMSNAPSLVSRSGRDVPAKQDSAQSAAEAAKTKQLLTRRKESSKGGRSFFKWSFRNAGSRSTRAQQRYMVTEDEE